MKPPSSDPAAVGSRLPTLLATLLAVAAAASTVFTFAHHARWRAELERLTGLAQAAGVPDRRPGLLADLARTADRDAGALLLARALLADELDRRWVAELEEQERRRERERGLERLDVAHDLGAAVLARRPGSWEAHMVVGASNYLRFTRRRDPRLGAAETWQELLQRAHDLAPTQPEPLRWLAATYLGNWSVLDRQQREEAVRILELAFEDAGSFDLFASSWLRVAPSLETALSIIPNRPGQWRLLRNYFARIGDWERVAMAAGRQREALRLLIEERLEEARRRLAGGDPGNAAQRLREVGVAAEVEAGRAPFLDEVAQRLPPGEVNDRDGAWMASWLEWSLRRFVDSGDPGLSSETVARLAGLAPRLLPALTAWGAVTSGDFERAESILAKPSEAVEVEGRSVAISQSSELDALARLALARAAGPSEAALTALEGVPQAMRGIRYHYVREQALKEPSGRDDGTRTAWQATWAARSWQPEAWKRHGRSMRLTAAPAATADGLLLTLVPTGPPLGVTTLHVDGRWIGTYPTTPGREIFVEMPIDVRPYSLELRSDRSSTLARANVELQSIEIPAVELPPGEVQPGLTR